MKTLFYMMLASLALLSAGCGEGANGNKNGKSPAFMFWCFRQEVVSSDFHVPEMDTAAIANYLQNRMRSVPGFVDCSCNLADRTLTIRYQSSVTRKMNFEEAIALSGFAANGRPADPAAKIPEGVK